MDKVKGNIRKVLCEAPSKITCTTDGWTSLAPASFIVVTGHFITSSWKLVGLILSFEEFDESHTGEALKDGLLKVIDDFGIRGKGCSLGD